MSRECEKGIKMRLQSSVHFNIFSELFYLKNVSSEAGYKLLLTPSFYKASISAQSSDGTIKQTPELIESVRNFCSRVAESAKSSFCLDKLTYLVELYRMVNIFDADDKANFQNHNFNGDKFEFILASNDKLIYPHDIKDALRVPFYFNGITSDEKLYQDIPVYIKTYDKHKAFVRSLTMQDRVVDKNLNQIWPLDTRETPVGLKKLLEQTTENVR